MKRDWELIRQILLRLEEKPDSSLLAPGSIEGYPTEEVSYHLKILQEAGFIEAEFKGGLYWGKELTWLGHELLEIVRERSFWLKVKETVKNRGLGFTFEAIKTVAEELIKKTV